MPGPTFADPEVAAKTFQEHIDRLWATGDRPDVGGNALA